MSTNGTMVISSGQPVESEWSSGMGAPTYHSRKTKDELKRSGPTALEAALQRLQLAKLSIGGRKKNRLNSGVLYEVLDAIGQKNSTCMSLMVTLGQPAVFDPTMGAVWRENGKSLDGRRKSLGGTWRPDGRLTITVKRGPTCGS